MYLEPKPWIIVRFCYLWKHLHLAIGFECYCNVVFLYLSFLHAWLFIHFFLKRLCPMCSFLNVCSMVTIYVCYDLKQNNHFYVYNVFLYFLCTYITSIWAISSQGGFFYLSYIAKHDVLLSDTYSALSMCIHCYELLRLYCWLLYFHFCHFTDYCTACVLQNAYPYEARKRAPSVLTSLSVRKQLKSSDTNNETNNRISHPEYAKKSSMLHHKNKIYCFQ
jgi:hypothetical protein